MKIKIRFKIKVSNESPAIEFCYKCKCIFLNLKWLPVVRRDDGVIETFSFDVGKCGHVGVANLLWGTSPTTDENPRVEELQLTEN